MYTTVEEVIDAINLAKQQFEVLNSAASTITSKVNTQGKYVVSTATNADQIALKEAQSLCAANPFEWIEESIKKLVLTTKPAAKPAVKSKVPAKKKPTAKPVLSNG